VRASSSSPANDGIIGCFVRSVKLIQSSYRIADVTRTSRVPAAAAAAAAAGCDADRRCTGPPSDNSHDGQSAKIH